jgi:hypothetical protein
LLYNYEYYTDKDKNKYLVISDLSEVSDAEISELIRMKNDNDPSWGMARNADSFVEGADKDGYARWLDMISRKGGKVGDLESIYKKYSDKDYWDTAHDIMRKKEERDYFVNKGDEKAKAMTDDLIEKFYSEKEKSDFFGYAEKVKKALDNKDSKWLYSNLRANQKVTLDLVEHYTGERAGKNQKEINAWIDKFISVPALGRGGRATHREGGIAWLITG